MPLLFVILAKAEIYLPSFFIDLRPNFRENKSPLSWGQAFARVTVGGARVYPVKAGACTHENRVYPCESGDKEGCVIPEKARVYASARVVLKVKETPQF